MRYGFIALSLLAACGGSQSNTATTTTTTQTTATATASVDAGRPRSGMSIHVDNVRLAGPLPESTESGDLLAVECDLVLGQFGASDLAGVEIVDARVTFEDGSAHVFRPDTNGFDGRIPSGETRTIHVTKVADSGAPRAGRNRCGRLARVDLSIGLRGTDRVARANSRRVVVRCSDQ